MMNFQAVWLGYVKTVKILCAGMVLLGAAAFVPNKPLLDAASAGSILFWACLVTGGVCAGLNARRLGYLQGGTVGMGLWLVRGVFMALLFPELLSFSDLGFSALSCVFWGAMGGLVGVNWAILKKQEKIQCHN